MKKDKVREKRDISRKMKRNYWITRKPGGDKRLKQGLSTSKLLTTHSMVEQIQLYFSKS